MNNPPPPPPQKKTPNKQTQKQLKKNEHKNNTINKTNKNTQKRQECGRIILIITMNSITQTRWTPVFFVHMLSVQHYTMK